MIKAVLFDLDDTLLGNHEDTFVSHYFGLLGEYAAKWLSQTQFLKDLLASVDLTVHNSDLSLTNYAVLWQSLTTQTGLDRTVVEAFFERFYREIFPQLRGGVQLRPSARPLVKSCLDSGLTVVIATNPLFPATAIEQRLAWAGVPANEFAYALVTTLENMHSTKPHERYYAEILARIDCPPEMALMVGDNWKNDMIPAAALGMATYWIPPNGEPAPDASLLRGWGTLDALYEQVQAGWLAGL